MIEISHILVVEDSPTAAIDLEAKIRHVAPKADLHKAFSYQEAVDLLSQQRFDVAFIDLQMPEKTGMDLILDVMQKDESLKDIPIIVTTGTKPQSFIADTLKSVTFRFLFKPVKVEELEEAFSSIPLYNF